MAEALGKIAAAVPGIALAGIRLPLAAVEEKQLPAGKQRPELQGKRKVVFQCLGFHRNTRHEESVEGAIVVCRYTREVLVGERRIEVTSSRSTPSLMARSNAASLQPPMPVSRSGVMLVE